MNYLAVDFSLNSPGICIYNDKSKNYHFISYIKPKTGTKAEQRLQEEISLFNDVTLVDQPDFTNKESFSSAELLKIKIKDQQTLCMYIQQLCHGAIPQAWSGLADDLRAPRALQAFLVLCLYC